MPEHNDLSPYADEMLGWTDHSSMAMLEWVVSMREGLSLVDKDPDNVLAVSYEALCASPEETLKRLLSFSDLDTTDEKIFRFAKQVLKVNDRRGSVHIHSCLEAPFQETMQRLGYDC